MFIFHSKLYPHLSMNSHGVVFAPNGHPDGVDYFGMSEEHVPLRVGLHKLERAVWREARKIGLHMQICDDGYPHFSQHHLGVQHAQRA